MSTGGAPSRQINPSQDITDQARRPHPGRCRTGGVAGPAGRVTYGGMLAHVRTFAAHNRTLVVLALRKAGIEDLRWDDPMTWVAEPV
jgi:hypothetical protein